MIYVENYMDVLKSLPANLQALITQLREEDAKIYHIQAELLQEIRYFCQHVHELDMNEKETRMASMNQKFMECNKVNEEKTLIAMAANDLVQFHVRSANENYTMVKEELLKRGDPRSSGHYRRPSEFSEIDTSMSYLSASSSPIKRKRKDEIEKSETKSSTRPTNLAHPPLPTPSHPVSIIASTSSSMLSLTSSSSAVSATSNPSTPSTATTSTLSSTSSYGSAAPSVPALDQPVTLSAKREPRSTVVTRKGTQSRSNLKSAQDFNLQNEKPTSAASNHPNPLSYAPPSTSTNASTPSTQSTQSPTELSRSSSLSVLPVNPTPETRENPVPNKYPKQPPLSQEMPKIVPEEPEKLKKSSSFSSLDSKSSRRSQSRLESNSLKMETLSDKSLDTREKKEMLGLKMEAVPLENVAIDSNDLMEKDLENEKWDAKGTERALPPNKRASIIEEAKDDEVYCHCRRGDNVGDMVGCDQEGCRYEWFHLKCVGLVKAPPKEVQWFCPECRQQLEGQKEGQKEGKSKRSRRTQI